MVSKKRQHYGEFNGFHAPVVPKAPRSIRKKLHKKSSSGNEICPFELLAAVADKLLQESEGSASSTSPEQKEQITISKEIVKQEPFEVKLKRSEDLLHSDNDSGIEHASIVTTSDFLKEVSTNVKLEVSDNKNGVIGTPSHGDVCDADMDIPNLHIEPVEKQTEDLLDKVINPRVLNSVHLPYYSDPVPSDCFVNRRDKNVKIGIRDDDENSFSCNHYSTKMKAYRLQSRSGYRRIRKMLTSKYWKTAPKLKDYEQFSNRRKRKLFHNSSKKPEYVQEKYVQETSSESISNSPERHPSKRVKFSIKSFKVPELYLEMPETSTVGSLKRTVMEALTAILGGELHVGVLLQGKKVRDDNRTLQQTGISLNSETLGFMLEPTLPEPSQSPVEKQPPMSPPECDNHQPLSTSPESPITDVGFSNSSPDPPSETKSDGQIEKSKEEIATDTKAIVPIISVNPEILSIVPTNHKLNKRSELSQRRTRRPFSVSEVESLVEAVETLGTGRWRDVKIRAFDDANHRTYVDLKDKWKTLVHTASISPQQRRGEPVPQNLLDRVLAAHAFWSQNQPKKHHGEPVQTGGTPVQVCLEMEG